MFDENTFKKSEYYSKIFAFHPDIPYRITSRENNTVELKEIFEWDNKERRNRYAKTICAFANTKGGFMIFGVKDKPRQFIGLQDEQFEKLDEADISSHLSNTLSQEIIFSKFVCRVQDRQVGVLYIEKSKHKPVMCIKDSEHFNEADIYYRYNSRTKKIGHIELNALLNEVKSDINEEWMDLMKNIALIGPDNTAILDIPKGKITKGNGTFMIDEKLIKKLQFIKEGRFREGGHPTLKLIGKIMPVSEQDKVRQDIRFTDNPDAPEYKMTNEEIIKEKYPLDYWTLISILRDRYSDFKQNEEFYELKRKLMRKKGLSMSNWTDPIKKQGTKKDFYSEKIIEHFDKHYTKKRNKKQKSIAL